MIVPSGFTSGGFHVLDNEGRPLFHKGAVYGDLPARFPTEDAAERGKSKLGPAPVRK